MRFAQRQRCEARAAPVLGARSRIMALALRLRAATRTAGEGQERGKGMTAYELLSTIIAAVGLLGGALGFMLSRTARASAKESNQVAARAQAESAEALRRSADASERVADVWERITTPPEPTVAFEVDATPDHTVGSVRNVGDLAARSLTVSGYPEQVRNLVALGPADLPPGQAIQFGIDERLSLPVRQVELVWTDDWSDAPRRETCWIQRS